MKIGVATMICVVVILGGILKRHMAGFFVKIYSLVKRRHLTSKVFIALLKSRMHILRDVLMQESKVLCFLDFRIHFY